MGMVNATNHWSLIHIFGKVGDNLSVGCKIVGAVEATTLVPLLVAVAVMQV
jgi:hypothetical protein